VRYASGGHVDNEVVGGTAFVLRRHEEGLSVSRPAVFSTKVDEALLSIRPLARLTLRRTGRYAEFVAESIKAAKDEIDEISELKILEDALEEEGYHPADPSHAQISGLPKPDSLSAEIAGDYIAQCVVRTHPAIVDAD